jgi:hypothetical protein
MAIKHAVLGNGNSVVEIVDNGRIQFSLFELPVGGRRSKGDSIFIGKASLPAAERGRVVPPKWDIGFV